MTSIIPIRDPDQTRIMSIKRASGKTSWTEHDTPKQARRQISDTNNGSYWKQYGQFFRFRYRINIYLKDGNQ